MSEENKKDDSEDVSGVFDRFMEGVVEGEEKKRSRKILNEDSPARRYIKRYGELPQNRIRHNG